MTTVVLYREGETLIGVESRGHSGFAEEGEDVVCAAVSTLLYALLVGLVDVARVEGVAGEADPEVPLIKVAWPRERADEISLLTKTVELSLREIASGSPEHVDITEVRS